VRFASERDLVAGDLHRGGEVERRIRLARGNGREPLAAAELVVGKARGLVAEDERHAALRGAATISGAHSRMAAAGSESSRLRAVNPTASTRSARASSSEATTRAEASTSAAPAASATASGSGKRRGATSRRSVRPIVFIARAAAPMLPGWLGRERTTAIRGRFMASL
jgi:hypothetical protein